MNNENKNFEFPICQQDETGLCDSPENHINPEQIKVCRDHDDKLNVKIDAPRNSVRKIEPLPEADAMKYADSPITILWNKVNELIKHINND